MPLTDDQRQTLATALGERAGLDVFPADIEVVENWLFHKNQYDDDIDCYHLPLPIEAEAWDSVVIAKSPFGTSDSSILAETLKALEDGYE